AARGLRLVARPARDPRLLRRVLLRAPRRDHAASSGEGGEGRRPRGGQPALIRGRPRRRGRLLGPHGPALAVDAPGLPGVLTRDARWQRLRRLAAAGRAPATRP